jgi:hypothetical protein
VREGLGQEWRWKGAKHIGSAALLSVVAACGTGSDEGASGELTEPVPFADYYAAIAEAMCSAHQRCYPDWLVDDVYDGDCDEYMFRSNEALQERTAAALDQGRVTYDADRGRDCVNAIRTTPCDSLGTGPVEGCEGPFEGTVPVAGECILDQECQGDAFCRLETTCPGTCTLLGTEGTHCTRAWECEPNLVCSLELAECVVAQPAWAVCNDIDLVCEPGLSCDVDASDPAGSFKCMAPNDVLDRSAGEACNLFEDEFCGDGLHCVLEADVYQDGICTAETASSGGSCHAAYPSQCPDDEYCDADVMLGETSGTCRPLPTTGEPCLTNASLARECPYGHMCLNGVCVTIQPLGGPCEDDLQCYAAEAHCVDGVCSSDVCAGFEPTTSE